MNDITIKIDRQHYRLGVTGTDGAELRKMVPVDDDDDLWLVASDVGDLRVDPETKIKLTDGMRFYTAPKYING